MQAATKLHNFSIVQEDGNQPCPSLSRTSTMGADMPHTSYINGQCPATHSVDKWALVRAHNSVSRGGVDPADPDLGDKTVQVYGSTHLGSFNEALFRLGCTRGHLTPGRS